MEFTDYDTRLGAYAVIIDDHRRLLLTLWNEGARPEWHLPGGGVDFEESAEQGAIREVFEESGYHVELTDLLGLDTRVVSPERRLSRRDRPMKAVRVFYAARVVGGELTHEVGGSTDEARWWPLDALPESLGTGARAALDLLGR